MHSAFLSRKQSASLGLQQSMKNAECFRNRQLSVLYGHSKILSFCTACFYANCPQSGFQTVVEIWVIHSPSSRRNIEILYFCTEFDCVDSPNESDSFDFDAAIHQFITIRETLHIVLNLSNLSQTRDKFVQVGKLKNSCRFSIFCWKDHHCTLLSW